RSSTPQPISASARSASRYQSASRLARFYGDLGWKGTDAENHLVTSAADNFFGVIGPTPVELLANDYRAIYTWPQTTKNEAALVALNGRYSVTDHWTVQSNLYYRRFNQEPPAVVLEAFRGEIEPPFSVAHPYCREPPTRP